MYPPYVAACNKAMRRLRWVVIVLAVFEAGWMAFDGARALIVAI
jgi:hypothetical protein